jgi:hypothetical protein
MNKNSFKLFDAVLAAFIMDFALSIGTDAKWEATGVFPVSRENCGTSMYLVPNVAP